MRCTCCNRKLPPHRILTGHKDSNGLDTEEDLCISCLGTVYYDVTEQYNILDRTYTHPELETPVTQLLPDVNL